MCGIVGIVGEGTSRDIIERMTDRLRHRGPDDRGVWSAEGVRLGHRRLCILDLSPAGRQPMTYGDFTIVYNGEIYNFRELRKELPGQFRSDCDTEVLLRLYAQQGPSCVERLQGMFAFAIWDSRRRKLFAARDRLGIKPFFYYEFPGGLAFASEVKALTQIAPRKLDRTALVDFFTYKYTPTPKTIYASIRKLHPAHTLEYDGTLRLSRYWEPEVRDEVRDEGPARERLEGLMAEIVPAHTIADVPVGVFLSGGLDSTALVASLDRPRTFTLGFDIEERSEAPYARRVADRFGTVHVERTIGSLDVEEALESLPGMFDEPFGDSAAWSTHIVSREARKEVTVALSGEGGDELFSGYRRYGKWMTYRSAAPIRWLCAVLPPLSPVGRSLYRRAALDVERYGALVGPFNLLQKQAILSPDLREPGYDDLWYLRQHWRSDLHPIKRMQWLDLHTYLPDDLLFKVDRASMAVSLEVRPPFLDHRLVEFALTLHPSLLRRNGTGKILLRRHLERQGVPQEVLTRPKRGFSMPVSRWMKDHPSLLDEALRRLHREGILRSAARPRLHSEQVWSLLMLDRWMLQARPT